MGILWIYINIKNENKMNDPVAIVVIALIAAAVFSIFYIIKSKHLERMAKIESGMIDQEFKDSGNIFLNIGILLCSLATAVFTSYLFSIYTKIPEYVIIPGFLLLFGGIGFLISFYISKKKSN
ncbi:hypothetical protein SAMN04487910_1533 [Aquimarina amphilecti]|uniref:DUF6249 domain-containing protein n=2 Tax=Flavobacteriaceae TaxID=49546 RepID=A0A1H7L624_AQUAM|nr:hypothetical protein SAMN04487910_1533 [Aquimarina amphilecti]